MRENETQDLKRNLTAIMSLASDSNDKGSSNLTHKKRVFITDFFQVKKKKVEKTSSQITRDNKTLEPNVQKLKTSNTTELVGESHEECDLDKLNDKESSTDPYASFCARYNFNKETWVSSLTEEQRDLLDIEIEHLHITWLVFLHKSLTKPYFLNLKRFLKSQSNKTIFPPRHMIYSWSHYTPLPDLKCLVLGQDPYHNYNQAHGLAFSVLEPTKPPPSLVNIYKTLSIDYPEFIVPDTSQLAKNGTPGGGNLTKWARSGVLMLNACLTVEAHKANSHAGKGWELFTEEVIQTAINYFQNRGGFVIMAWGSPAQNRVARFARQLQNSDFLVLKTVHPSPLSAHRGFFQLQVFKKCNEWLDKKHKKKINWGLIDGNVVS
ncbi:uncharacterized protein PRCAT00005000001 [Priceomyces carsonii]|uniref:uncharacterized protein n=1 Tax=Priceomyces carsonii TaxID=28549 RepID=UPI002EDA6526|nr:unnamed protein product [Priceomyces carsonii]